MSSSTKCSKEATGFFCKSRYWHRSSSALPLRYVISKNNLGQRHLATGSGGVEPVTLNVWSWHATFPPLRRSELNLVIITFWRPRSGVTASYLKRPIWRSEHEGRMHVAEGVWTRRHLRSSLFPHCRHTRGVVVISRCKWKNLLKKTVFFSAFWRCWCSYLPLEALDEAVQNIVTKARSRAPAAILVRLGHLTMKGMTFTLFNGFQK